MIYGTIKVAVCRFKRSARGCDICGVSALFCSPNRPCAQRVPRLIFANRQLLRVNFIAVLVRKKRTNMDIRVFTSAHGMRNSTRRTGGSGVEFCRCYGITILQYGPSPTSNVTTGNRLVLCNRKAPSSEIHARMGDRRLHLLCPGVSVLSGYLTRQHRNTVVQFFTVYLRRRNIHRVLLCGILLGAHSQIHRP